MRAARTMVRMGLVVAVAALCPLVVAGRARAGADRMESGVWWRAQPDGGSAPAPPQVPPGGLWVSSDVSGPSAISAIRFSLTAGDTDPVVTLAVAKETTAPSSPAGTGTRVSACVITGEWAKTDPAAPGPWSSRPNYDCAKGHSEGVPSADGTTMTFDLRPLTDATSPSVTFAILPAMVPGPVPAGASPVPVPAPALPAAPAPAPAPPDPTSPDIWPTFDLTFQPVTPAAVSVASGPVPEAPPAPDSYSPFAAPVDSAGSFPASEAASPPLAPPVADPQAAAAPAPAVARTPPRVALPVVAASKAARSGEQALAGAVFLGLCAWAWKVFNQDAKAGLASAGAGFRSLYDTPSAGPAAARRRFGTGPRVGRPPPLR